MRSCDKSKEHKAETIINLWHILQLKKKNLPTISIFTAHVENDIGGRADIGRGQENQISMNYTPIELTAITRTMQRIWCT